MKPKIKTVYPVYRVREDLLRIGAEPGITDDVEESHGEMARFLSLLDGQKDIKEVTRAMQGEFPEITEQDVLELLDFAFGELALHRVYGEVLATNKISARMVDSLGFALEGIKREACFRNGVFLDVYIYGLLAREWSANKESEFRG